jgi:hypothetical protein
LALLASAGVLAALDEPAPHEPTPVAGAVVAMRGTMAPFQVPDGPQWEAVAALLDKVTYVLETGADALVLVTAASPIPTGRDVALEGLVLWEGPHPDAPARGLVLLQGSWDAPVLPR